MLTVPEILPFFMLIILGYGTGRTQLLGEEGITVLNRFVVNFAMPALIISAIAPHPINETFNVKFLIAYLSAELAVYTLSLWIAMRVFSASLGEAALLGLAASWSNVGYMGIAMTDNLFNGWIAPAILATSSDMIIITGITVLLLEYDHKRGKLSALPLTLELIRRVLTHPFILTLVLSLTLSLTKIGIPKILEPTIIFTAKAAGPVALFAIGSSLALRTIGGHQKQIIIPIALKLLVLPFLFWLFASKILGLNTNWLIAGIILCSLPTAGSVWVLAQSYGQAVRRVTSIILFSTLLSLLSLLILLPLLSVAS